MRTFAEHKQRFTEIVCCCTLVSAIQAEFDGGEIDCEIGNEISRAIRLKKNTRNFDFGKVD